MPRTKDPTPVIKTSMALPVPLHKALAGRTTATRSVNSQVVEAIERYLKAEGVKVE